LQDFDYAAPKSIDEVVALLASGEARILSGGTDLLVQLREGRKKASTVVDIKRVPEVNELCYDPSSGLRLGAAVPCYRITSDAEIARVYPGIIDAVGLIGGIQIQGRATVGGNLCNASPAADSIPALMVHEAVCEIVGPGRARIAQVEDFCTGPGQNGLRPGEFLVALRLPPPPKRFGARYLRFTPRNEMDIAVVGAGVSVILSEDLRIFQKVRISLGAVAPTPLLVKEAGQFLAGREVSDANMRRAAQIAQEAAQPITDMRGSVDQRKTLAGVLTRRALEGAVERAVRG